MIARLRLEAEGKVREKFNLHKDVGLNWDHFSHMEDNVWEDARGSGLPFPVVIGVHFNEDGTVKEIDDLPEE